MKKEKPKGQKKEKKVNQEKQNEIINDKQPLSWIQIMLLIGKPIWDATKKKFRVINGYKATLSKVTNSVIAEITFTDTLYWEEFTQQKLYINVPIEKKEQKEDIKEIK